MATALTGDDSARAALRKSDEIMVRLDEITPAGPSVQQQLDALGPLLSVAVESGNEAEVRRLVGQGKDILRAEKVVREHKLEEANNYFDEARKKYGETGEETTRSSQAVTGWEKSLQDFDVWDQYYDDVLASMHPPATQDSAPQPQAQLEGKEPAKTLEEAIVILNNAEAAYNARIEEIQTEKKNIAAQLTEKRVAELKAALPSSLL